MRSTDIGNIVVAKSYADRALPIRSSKKLRTRLIAKALCIAGIALLTYSGSLLADDALFDNIVDYNGGDFGGGDFGNFDILGDDSPPDTKELDQVTVTAHAGPDEQLNIPPLTVGNYIGRIAPTQISKNIAPTSNHKKDSKNPCPYGDPVVIGTGAKIEAVTEFALPGEMGLTFARYYNSQYFNGNAAAALGTWTTSVDYHLGGTSCSNVVGGVNPCAPIRFEQPDGSQLYFTQTPNPNTNSNNSSFQLTGPFVETDGNRNPNGGMATLTYNANGTYTLHNEDSRVLTFNTSGIVLSINDVSGIGWAITHPNSTDTVVTHTSGQSYTIHNALPAWGKGAGSVTVTDPAGNVYQYQSETTLASAAAFSSIGLISSATTPGPNPTTTAYKYSNPSLPVTSANLGSLYLDELSEVDYNGVAHDVTSYDTVGRAVQTMNADGTDKTTFAYGSTSTGPTTTVTNALGHTVVYQYNGNAQVVSTTGNASASCPAYFSSRQYDANGNLSSVTDNNGNTNHMTYAASGQLTQKVEAVGTPVQRTTDYVWDPTPGADRLLSVTVEGLLKKAYTFNAQGRRTSVTTTNLTAAGVTNQTHTTTIAYTLSSNGMVATKTITPSIPTNTRSYTYDGNGNVTSVSNGLGQATVYGNYSALGQPQAVTTPTGDVTYLTYDARSRVATLSHTHGGATNSGFISYDANSGLPALIVKYDNEQTRNTYDADFKLTSSTWTGPSGAVITTTNTYNALGNVTGTTKALQGSTTPAISSYWDYDELGRVIATRGNNGQKTSLTYDLNGNVATSTDSGGRVTKFNYDALNRLTSTTNANGGVTAALHGLGDRVTQVTDPRGLVTSYAYDAFGQLWTLTSPDTGTTKYVYNAYGQRTSVTPNSGVPISYQYDALGRITSEVGGTKTHTFTYDSCTYGQGQLCGFSDESGTTALTYNIEGRLESRVITVPNHGTGAENWAYDGLGRLIQQGDVNGTTVTYTWSDDQISNVSATLYGGQPFTIASNISYDAGRHMIGLTYGNGIQRSQTYDSDGRFTGTASILGSATIQNLGLSWDNVNRITNITNAKYSAVTQAYGYDNLDRLTSQSGPASLTLTYDANGNRTLQSGNSVVNGTFSDAVTVDATSNRIEQRGGHMYSYDANGNRATDSYGGSTASYVYDAFNRMSAASRNTAISICETNGNCPTYPATTTTYYTNALGQRMQKFNSASYTLYGYGIDGNMDSEVNNTQGFSKFIYLNGQPIALINNGNTYYFHNDQLGRPEELSNSSGSMVSLDFNFAFDRSAFVNNVQPMDLGLPGQVYDVETGNWSNGFRDYDSSDGRYLESDPIGLAGGTNTYAYVGNNPLGYADPSGLDAVAYMTQHPIGAGNFGPSVTPTLPDVVQFDVGWGPFSISATYTKYGDMFVGGNDDPFKTITGTFFGPWKAGVAISDGWLQGCDQSRQHLNNVITGQSAGGSAYAGFGGGFSTNSSGTIINAGVGFGGISPSVGGNIPTGNIFGNGQ